MPFTPGELRREASSSRNAKTEAFRAGEGVKAPRIQVEDLQQIGSVAGDDGMYDLVFAGNDDIYYL